MKHKILILIQAVLITNLFGCGSGGGDSTDSTTSSAVTGSEVTTTVTDSSSQAAADSESPAPGTFTMAQTLSDGAQRTTIAFAGLGMITGNLQAQSFFPPGKVADYWGFQYLRDNDSDGMGHNTSFLTRVASNVLYILDDQQLAVLTTLASSQVSQINEYAYQRYPLMQAFRSQMLGDLPLGTSGLSVSAVKQASKELYQLDGQISYDRAVVFAEIYRSMSASQLTYLDDMKGGGWESWADIDQSVLKERTQGLSHDESVAVMTYAGDLFSWYAGSLEADAYFCPERQGTYYGSFYIKDAPAIGVEGYSINEQLTATAGRVLSDSSEGYVSADQAELVSSLVDTQRSNLYAGSLNIVQARTDISTALRTLITTEELSDSFKAQVLAEVLEKSGVYGELDGENNFHYASVFAQLYQSLSDTQMEQLTALRQEIMSGTYDSGDSFDFSIAANLFLYSAQISDSSTLDSYLAESDALFE
ncbi:hypothetical protein [Psychromonas ossibalaenae]|uniref:hypothetical protein n=1 Tax=Psychromonas ossibalaenae TaxID=444922 RepID=UPI00037E43DC|nr:hypothetical protein [Psychromonas ossibalaenae]